MRLDVLLGKIVLLYASGVGKQYCITYFHILRRELRGLECEVSAFVELRGLGYRVAIGHNLLILTIGYSHKIYFFAPYGVHFALAGIKSRIIRVFSNSPAQLQQTIAAIMRLRPPGIYKERGIYKKYQIAQIKSGKKKKFS